MWQAVRDTTLLSYPHHRFEQFSVALTHSKLMYSMYVLGQLRTGLPGEDTDTTEAAAQRERGRGPGPPVQPHQKREATTPATNTARLASRTVISSACDQFSLRNNRICDNLILLSRQALKFATALATGLQATTQPSAYSPHNPQPTPHTKPVLISPLLTPYSFLLPNIATSSPHYRIPVLTTDYSHPSS